MSYLRLPFEELDYVLLQHVVGVRHTLVLAQMLRPRGHEERFQKPARSRRIFEDTPRTGAVPQPFVLKLV
jgi:hypothetical protein